MHDIHMTQWLKFDKPVKVINMTVIVTYPLIKIIPNEYRITYFLS